MLQNKKSVLCIMIIIIIIISVLIGCVQGRESKKNIVAEQPESLCVFYTPNNAVLISNFEKMYPEYELEKVILSGNIEDELARGRIPDLIIAQGSTPLIEWHEKGYIRDIGSLYGEDERIMSEDYFPGALDVGCNDGMLLAMPLTVQVTYLTVRKSVLEESKFGQLTGEYTLDQFLDVLEEEYSGTIERNTLVVSGIPFYSDFIGLLFATGAITRSADQVTIDQDVFERLYALSIANYKNFNEDAYVSVGVYRNAAIDPRDGNYKASYWYGYPPQVGVLYAQSVNRQLLEEDIDVFWWPMLGETKRYAAEIATLGMIGAESQYPQTAYEVLRLMMDMPMNEWIQPKRIGLISMHMYMPIQIKNAKDLCAYVENSGLTEFCVNSTENEYVFVEKQVWDEFLKEKVIDMIDGVQYVYRLDDYSMRGVRVIADEYISSLNVNAADACYEDIIKLLNYED